MAKKNTQPDKVDETIDLASETLTGDVRDFLLDRVKNLSMPWPKMTEEEQAGVIHSCTAAAEHLVRQIVVLIASQGRKAIVGNLLQVTRKDSIKAQVEFAKTDELRHELFDAQGSAVLLVVADAEPFTGERAPAEPDPNQTELMEAA